VRYQRTTALHDEIEAAVAAWKAFHKKAQPRELIKVKVPWPQSWSYAGVAKTTYYRSDKWKDDGDFERYYHDHDSGPIRVWHPKGMFPWLAERPQPTKRKYPTAVAVLGYSLGIDVERHDTKRLRLASPSPGSFLVVSPDRTTLWIVEPRNGVTTMLQGSRLRVEARGIVG